MAPYFNEPFYVGFNPGGYELGLLPDGDEAAGALTYWGVDDVTRAVESALAAGAHPSTVRSVTWARALSLRRSRPPRIDRWFHLQSHFALIPSDL